METSHSQDILKAIAADPVIQFSIFTENKVGRLLEVVNRFAMSGIHILALSTIDATESSIMRVITDDPQGARNIFDEEMTPVAETEMLIVELNAADQLQDCLCALLQAEVNVYYTYPLITRPEGKAALAMCVEDLEISAQSLTMQDFKVLTQRDISR